MVDNGRMPGRKGRIYHSYHKINRPEGRNIYYYKTSLYNSILYRNSCNLSSNSCISLRHISAASSQDNTAASFLTNILSFTTSSTSQISKAQTKNFTKTSDRVIKCYSNDGDTFKIYVNPTGENDTPIETVTASNNIVLFTAATYNEGDVIKVEGETTFDTFTIG